MYVFRYNSGIIQQRNFASYPWWNYPYPTPFCSIMERGVLEACEKERVPEKKSRLNYSHKTSRIWVMNERTDAFPAARI